MDRWTDICIYGCGSHGNVYTMGRSGNGRSGPSESHGPSLFGPESFLQRTLSKIRPDSRRRGRRFASLGAHAGRFQRLAERRTLRTVRTASAVLLRWARAGRGDCGFVSHHRRGALVAAVHSLARTANIIAAFLLGRKGIRCRRREGVYLSRSPPGLQGHDGAGVGGSSCSDGSGGRRLVIRRGL